MKNVHEIRKKASDVTDSAAKKSKKTHELKKQKDKEDLENMNEEAEPIGKKLQSFSQVSRHHYDDKMMESESD